MSANLEPANTRALSRFTGADGHGGAPGDDTDPGLVPRTGGVTDVEAYFASVIFERPGSRESWDVSDINRHVASSATAPPMTPAAEAASSPAFGTEVAASLTFTAETPASPTSRAEAAAYPAAGTEVATPRAFGTEIATTRAYGTETATSPPVGAEIALANGGTRAEIAVSGAAGTEAAVPVVAYTEFVVAEPLTPYWHPDLIAALEQLSAEVARVRLPLDLPGVEAARRAHEELHSVLTMSVLPRLREPSRPLLVSLGGGTGVGKSTLLNSLLGDVVSPGGVVRPTTRQPILVCAPGDAGAFGGVMGSVGTGTAISGVAFPAFATPRPHPSLPPGLALLDTPDIDSVVAGNRAVGTRLMACADVVVLVTSAERYADAPPWRVLKRAAERGTPLAVVLDRVPAEVTPVVQDACEALLEVNGLGGAPLFVVETQTMAGGLLPTTAVSGLGSWLQRLAEDRARVGARAVRGRLEAFGRQVAVVAGAAAEQWMTVDSLQQIVERVYTAERMKFRGGLENGDLFGGEVLVRWQELLGVESVAALLDGGDDASGLRDALVEAVAQGNRAAMERATRKTREEWHQIPGAPDLAPGRLPDATAPAVAWLERLPGMVRDQMRTTRRASRSGDGARGAGLLLGIAAIAGRIDDKRPASALAVHEHVRAVFGEDGSSRLLEMARTGLHDACATLLERAADAHRAQLGAYQVKPHTADALRTAEENVRVAR